MSDKKLIVDLAKGTQTYVDLTPEEIEQREADAAANAAAEAKASGQAKLAALGLTAEEISALSK